MNRTLKRSKEKTKKEQDRQANMLSCACFTVLWNDYGWREQRIMRRFASAVELMEEGYDRKLTPFEILEEETGIELFLEGDKSYHEYMFLSNDVDVRPLSNAEIIYMRSRSLKFTQMILLASLCVVLHREDKWGVSKLESLIHKVDIIRRTLGNDEKSYMAYMLSETGKDARELWGNKHD